MANFLDLCRGGICLVGYEYKSGRESQFVSPAVYPLGEKKTAIYRGVIVVDPDWWTKGASGAHMFSGRVYPIFGDLGAVTVELGWHATVYQVSIFPVPETWEPRAAELSAAMAEWGADRDSLYRQVRAAFRDRTSAEDILV